MVRVVPDTNIVGGTKSRPLESNEMRRLIDETRRGNLQLVVPELVLRESANLWCEQLVEQASVYNASVSVLHAADLVPEADGVTVDRDAVRSLEERRLRGLVEDAGGLVAPLPQVAHDDVVERALRRAQPFDARGRNGYRDVLLWETILELGDQGDTIVFIARDKAAFFPKHGAEGLAHELIDEVEARHGRRDGVKLYFEPSEGITAALQLSIELARQEQQKALAEQRTADEQALEILNRLLADDPGFAALLADAVDEALRYWDLGPDLRAFGIEEGDVYGANIDMVESLHQWRFVSAHVAEDGLVLSEVSADVQAAASATLHPSTATMLDGNPRVRIHDFGYGTSRAEGEVDVAARVTCDVVVNVEAAQLASLVTISHFEPLDV